MHINEYALEEMMKSRLAELRAAAARQRLIASLGTPSLGVWAALRSMLHRDGPRSRGREIASPRPA